MVLMQLAEQELQGIVVYVLLVKVALPSIDELLYFRLSNFKNEILKPGCFTHYAIYNGIL